MTQHQIKAIQIHLKPIKKETIKRKTKKLKVKDKIKMVDKKNSNKEMEKMKKQTDKTKIPKMMMILTENSQTLTPKQMSP